MASTAGEGKKRADRAAHGETQARPRNFAFFTNEIARRRGVPKTPQGWMTLGLTFMAILIAVALWLRS
jgi:hypothetical protein